eukprot:CAMPEP_0206160242 /NCGR_PEP_ID=MMETSP1474-20131121/6594_1 /ASSEMBLY_ACC=CAM_ASM_001110 /TAXON_ID=97495 /ORGANISM="Imantonia sp., Strain RCC918" /LENGTH=155 /DNA_ID=CAMNT_0053561475 /DNA_START=32 /DNA_END=496 /DNA_ORIENTATION=-
MTSKEELVQQGHSLSKAAEEASFAGFWQEAVRKFQNAASIFRKAADHADPRSRSAIEKLAEAQEKRVNDLLLSFEAARIATPPLTSSELSDSFIAPEPLSPRDAKSKQLLAAGLLNSSNDSIPEEAFSWEKFWSSVDDLLNILPKPMFETQDTEW